MITIPAPKSTNIESIVETMQRSEPRAHLFRDGTRRIAAVSFIDNRPVVVDLIAPRSNTEHRADPALDSTSALE